MPDPTHMEGTAGTAVVLVRNAVDHDSRVLREARTLRGLGMDTVVVGVVSFTQTRQVTEHDGIPVRRIGPRSRLAWLAYREISRLRPSTETRSGGPARRGLPPARALARRVLRWLATVAYYTRAIPEVVRRRPALVHCNDYNTMWIGIAARLLVGSAVVYDSHELWADRNLRSEPRAWLVACEALFTRAADRVITTSPAYAAELARRYRVPAPAVVRNIPERSRESRQSRAAHRGGSRDGPLAVYVGGLQPGRGLEHSIRAMALLPGVRLRLLGPGAPEYRVGLERLVRSLGLENRVELAEPVPPAEVLDALSGSDVGLALIEPASLSYRLTLPNKLFEYALAGVPILGSDLPMISRFIGESGLGEVVDPADVEAVARKLASVLDPERNERYREAAARVAATLDWSTERGLLEEVYRGALSARGSNRR